MDVLITLCAISAVVMAAKAFSRSHVLAANIRGLNSKVEALDRRLSRLDGDPTPATEERPAEAPVPQLLAEAPATASAHAEKAPHVGGTPISAMSSSRDWEKALVENWLVWLGGLALALGAAFLVKLSVDHGLLTPVVRVLLGTLLGVGLWAGAEWLGWGQPVGTRPSNVCQALAAAGAAAIFASLYAAYQLYGMLAPAVVFPLLALTCAATVMMSLQHGPFVAALGLTGAFAVPLLVGAEAPGALPLFAYLTLVSAGSLALLRHRAWWWLAWVSLAGSIGWALLWLVTAYRPEDFWVLGGYLLAQLGLFASLRRGIVGVPPLAGVIDQPMVRITARTAFWAIALIAIMLVHLDAYSAAALSWAVLVIIALMGFAYRDTDFDDVIAAAGVLAAALLASWDLPVPAEQKVGLLRAVAPEQVGRFIAVATAFAALLGARRLHRVAASVAAGSVGRALGGDATDNPRGLELAAAGWAAKRRDGAIENELVLAAYAVGVLAGTILAAVFVFDDAWLTVALALHLPALGWVEGRLRLSILRRLALAIAVAVLVRLVFNPELLRYPLSDTPFFNWLLYGYGVPAAAFIVATRQFGSRADDVLVKLLEAGSVVFSVLLVTLQLWHALGDRPRGFVLDDFELNASEMAAWLVMAGWLLYLGERRRRTVLRWSGILLFGAATIFGVGWQAIILSPAMPYTGAAVQGGFLLDSLLLAYALPAALYAVIGMYRLGPRPVWRLAQVLAAGFAFLWVTLEIRHFFHGERLNQGPTGEAEWYAYSAVWLAFASAGLAAALAWRSPWLRRTALLGIGLVVGKVFLSDMADLSGTLRALSFIGLGAVLVTIGYAYRRLQPLQRQE